MQQRELVAGFSELKDLLIRTYKINRDREFIRLYFSEKDNQLLMHDYEEHQQALTLSRDIINKQIRDGLSANSHNLIKESLLRPKPSEFWNIGFKLNGFFRS